MVLSTDILSPQSDSQAAIEHSIDKPCRKVASFMLVEGILPVDKESVLQQMRTAEGHLHTVTQMLEDNLSCPQVLHQLNEVQCSVEAAGSTLLRMEFERCLQALRDNPCPDQRCEQLARLVNLYPFVNKFPVKIYETATR
jgi:DNA-binding FrmR family transcriptional regulator